MIPCDFAIDPICIPEEYVAAKQDVYGLRAGEPAEPSADVLERTGAKVVNLFSDAIITLTPSGMMQTCDQDVCVHYLKTCNVVAFTCRYVIGVQSYPPDPAFKFVPRELLIRATSAEALNRAQHAIEAGRKGALARVPLVQLTGDVSKAELEKRSAWSID